MMQYCKSIILQLKKFLKAYIIAIAFGTHSSGGRGIGGMRVMGPHVYLHNAQLTSGQNMYPPQGVSRSGQQLPAIPVPHPGKPIIPRQMGS